MNFKNPFKKESGGGALFLLASAMAFFLLIVPLERKGAAISAGVVCVLYFLARKQAEAAQFPQSRQKKYLTEHVFAVVIVLGCAVTFFDNWIASSKISAIADILHLPVEGFLVLIAGILAAVAYRFVVSVLCLMAQESIRGDAAVSRQKAITICIFSAIGVITVCSKSSFLYPLNDWVDANCFFTVGRAMMNGVVVYRDLWEQKGPFLYFLHGLASLVSDNSFLGVYFLEITAAAFFLYFSYEIMRLFTKDGYALTAVPLIAAVVYTSRAFCHGDSAEELCLPFLAFALWVSLKAFRRGQEISLKSYLLVGITSGLVFWTKFTMVGFYLGWFLVPAVSLVRKKQWKQLCQAVLAVAAGVLISTVPFIIYFGLNHAIGDWLEVYLYNNLFLYTVSEAESTSKSFVLNLIAGYKFACGTGLMLVLLGALGAIWLAISAENKIAVHFCCTIVLTFAVTFIGGRLYDYYTLILAVFAPLGMGAIVNLLAEKSLVLHRIINRKAAIFVLAAMCIGAALLTTPNRYLMGTEKEELPQYQFKKIVDQKENPTLLNYGFLDGGFYTACEIIPHCKAFCELNIPLEDMHEMQETYVREGLCDFVVTREQTLAYDNYELIAQYRYPYKNEMIYTYYLYQLK